MLIISPNILKFLGGVFKKFNKYKGLFSIRKSIKRVKTKIILENRSHSYENMLVFLFSFSGSFVFST